MAGGLPLLLAQEFLIIKIKMMVLTDLLVACRLGREGLAGLRY